MVRVPGAADGAQPRSFWIPVICGAAILTIGIGARQSFGIFQKPIAADLKVGRELIGRTRSGPMWTMRYGRPPPRTPDRPDFCLEPLMGDGVFRHFRPIFWGTLIANVVMDAERGNRLIAQGLADLVAFGPALHCQQPTAV